MNVRKKNMGETRNRLIEAASNVFALKDFKTATIAEICNQAGANLAAVNYHFGSKESLYREAWLHIKAYTEHVIEFSLGGISSTAKATQCRPSE